MAKTRARHRFTVDEYHRMVEAGILTEYSRVELIRGELVVMASVGTRHTACVKRLNEIFGGLGDRALRSVQDPVQLEDSEPEPDFVLLVRREDYYVSAHPAPADIHLIVEVSDTSQAFDRTVKGPLYAENRVREYWIVDLEADRVEIHRRPEEGTWADVRTAGPGERITVDAFPEFEVEVDRILP